MFEDINNYVISDLLKIFGIEENIIDLNKKNFIKIANILIKKTENNDSKLETFLQEAKKKLLIEIDKHTTNKISTVYDKQIISDTLNPNYQPFTSRIVCVDSEFRNNIFSDKLNTDFTITLSETIKNVISLKLYSIQIPKTWYNIDAEIGNNTFKIDNSFIEIESGNYTIDNLIETINKDISNHNISFIYNNITQKVTIKNSTNSNHTITFYDQNIINSKCNTSTTSNFNLGWNLGFRKQLDDQNQQIIDLTSIVSEVVAQAIASLYNPKYCLIVLDDFNKNHVNNGLISAISNESKLSIPNYRYLDSCIKDPSSNDILYIASNPRRLTQAQLYSLNTIAENRKESNHNTIAPTSNNLLALIPLNNNSSESNIVEYGEGLILNKRNYFGPVDIEKINVKLLNEKGHLMNLNGVDWSFTIHIEQLYKKNS
jgi:hypothetical protein